MSNQNRSDIETKIQYDIVLVGGSPSNFALAHRLVDLAKQSGQHFTMAILEKGKEFGAHVLSGAVSNPRVIKKLFPNYEELGFPLEAVCSESHMTVLGNEKVWNVPGMLVPDGMKKEGYFILTLSHVVYWMANQLKEKLKEMPEGHPGIEIDFFPGFAAHEVLYDPERPEKVIGVQVVEANEESADIERLYARLVCFGDKGFLSRDLIAKLGLRENPQSYAVGVKEVWELKPEKACTGKVWHTMGFPVVDGSFGGGFVYGMKDNKLTIGLIIALDSENPNINPQQRLQDYKKHPWLQDLIDGGKLQKYGAAILPYGGFYSLPQKFAVDGAMILGDALGVLDASALSGIDKGMECGYQAADVIHGILKNNGDFNEGNLTNYQTRVMSGFVGNEMKAGRYFHYAWNENPRLLKKYMPIVMEGIDNGNPIGGLINVGLRNNPFQCIGDALRLKGLMEGTLDIGPIKTKPDYQHIVPNYVPAGSIQVKTKVDKETLYSRADAVFYAHTKYHEENRHIDEFNADVCVTCISRYDKLGKEVPCVSDCTAEVHRIDEIALENAGGGVAVARRHGMSLENCVQCRTCEFVCPEVNLKVRPTMQGSGPDFMGL
ncbi:MAG: hypothetical protein VKJ04_10585 [Vampirovibrionales bacterium]|nr:hypothetical protein [Vampirovibrionales bacterium]